MGHPESEAGGCLGSAGPCEQRGQRDRAAGTGRGSRWEARWAVPFPRPGCAARCPCGVAPASHLTVLPSSPAQAWLAPVEGFPPW